MIGSVLDRDGDASAAAVGMPSPSLSSRPLDETSPVADGLVSSSGPVQPSEVLAGWGSAGAAPEHIDGQLVLTGAEFRRGQR